MRLATILAAGAFALAGTACSGSNDAAVEAIVTSPPPATPASTTEPTTTTITAPTTTATLPPTAVLPATAPTEPTTTVDLSADVRTGYLAAIEAYFACLRSPSTCDPTVGTAEQGTARAGLTRTAASMTERGLFDGQEDWGYVVVEEIAFDAPTVARLKVCAWDTAILYGPPAEEGGEPTIVKNRPDTVRLDYVMYLEASRWLIGEETLVSKTPEVNECPPEG